jgi:hypothetical protein
VLNIIIIYNFMEVKKKVVISTIFQDIKQFLLMFSMNLVTLFQQELDSLPNVFMNLMTL